MRSQQTMPHTKPSAHYSMPEAWNTYHIPRREGFGNENKREKEVSGVCVCVSDTSSNIRF